MARVPSLTNTLRVDRPSLWRWALGIAIACALLMLMGAFEGGTALAQAEVPAARQVTADEVNEVARELWCPLCSGVRLDSCELKACDQMKDVIAIKLAEGEDTESIQAYFLEQYGPQVLGEPPREGFNWLAWILPIVAAVVGGGLFWRMTRRMVRSEPHAGAVPLARHAETEDDYERKLEEELAKYG